MKLVSRKTSLRIRRVFRRRKRQVEDISSVADKHIDKHIFRRLIRLAGVRRFVVGWSLLVGILMVTVVLQTRAMESHYKDLSPVAGGTFTEGILGSFTDANPIYATNAVDSSVAKLVFAGLLKNDANGQLVNDLADKWQVDESSQTYTVHLRPNLKWHDGKPLTADDVVFTYELMQNPDARSHLQASWRGIKVSKVDNRTVTFKLPNKLSAFPYSLTTGLLPKHILKDVPPEQLRSHKFNTQSPVGAGPFKFDRVQVTGDAVQREERVGLSGFDDFYAGKPKINRFIIKTFKDEDAMSLAYSKKQIDAMANLPTVSDEFNDDSTTQELSAKMLGEVAVFFKTSQPPLNDMTVRNALVSASNRAQVVDNIPYPLAIVDEPLLKSHVGYNKTFAQVANGDTAKANGLLDGAGWVKDPATGIRSKEGKSLSFKLVSQTNSEYASVTQTLQKQWKAVGVDVQVSLQSEQELQSTIAQHSYDALLYAVSLGSDPDVFAYWHGSQADIRSETRLNFSEYKSSVANEGLEGGRTRYDPGVRAVKYKTFLESWQKDAPALVLYQPRYLFVVRSPFSGFNTSVVTSATDRYANVTEWTVKEDYRY